MSSVDTEQVEERLTTGILGQWYAVAKSVQVKHDKPHALTALGRNLVLWRDTAGKLHCLEDYCPHRGARLSRGEVNGDNISCRYHGVTLDGSGIIVRVPAMPGCALEGRKAVQSYAVIEATSRRSPERSPTSSAARPRRSTARSRPRGVRRRSADQRAGGVVKFVA